MGYIRIWTLHADLRMDRFEEDGFEGLSRAIKRDILICREYNFKFESS